MWKWAAAALIICGNSSGVDAIASEPDHPRAEQSITIVVPYAEGGPTDKVARPAAEQLGKIMGRPVQLVFQGGDGATKAPRDLLASAPRDGSVLLLHNIGMASAPTLYRRLGFDPQKDFVPIGLVADSPMLILGKKSLPPTTGADLWPYIKANEATLTVAYGGPGGAGQLCGLMLEAALNVRLLWIPYTGTGPAMADLQQGRADLLCDQATNAAAAVDSGTIKAYALTANQRLQRLPAVPTAASTGISGVKIVVWHALYAPRGTSEEAVIAITKGLQGVVQSEEFVKAMSQVGAVPATAHQATPAALRAHLRRETAKWKRYIIKAGQFAD